MRSFLLPRLLMAVGALLSLAFASVAADKPTCAVLTFQPGTGCSADEAKFISDRYAALLSQLGTHTVLARSEMERILTVQKWNMSDYCSATECAVEAGKMLSVQYVVIGTVGHVGALYSMNTTLVEIETGKVTVSAVTDFKGRLEDFVRGAPADNIKSLFVVRQTPKDWATLPPEPFQPQTQGAEPVHKPLTVKAPSSSSTPTTAEAFYFTPMIGVSMLSGVVGAELQKSHVSLNAGWTPAPGIALGLKYYFRAYGHSGYVGACYDTIEDNGRVLGGVAGYRWRWPNRWNLTLGLGVGQVKSDEGDDVEDDGKTLMTVVPDIAFGYSF